MLKIYRQSAGVPQSPILGQSIGRMFRVDGVDGGAAEVTGTTGNGINQNGPYRVRLFDRVTGRMVREVWSDSAGAYRFGELAAGRMWFVVMHDHAPDANNPVFMNAVIQDMVST